ncbi:butyrophilin subfamily 1 member A1-like isoform X2 [Acipenser oxyrinchus oxyrinchus]|uniref:Butyrophilin subfamily 1 member A1-like isoform X2 n=1 Tax=Acipenser oxyrinchus oxyrinchus TaxID=40147 RepID=A0AAD8CJ29_ACIOX|nr:butyrophilin subfamily 1 member A1-like isoform X2 [Acipenser oxyrinchus oxyrinchus]
MRRLFPYRICLLFLFSFVYATQTDEYSVEVLVDEVYAHVGDTVTLPCRLSPLGDAVRMEVRWFKEGIEPPLYLYTLQNPVSSIQPDEYRNRTRLFIEEVSVGNLSLQLSNITISDLGRYTCSVIHKTKYAKAVVELKLTGEVLKSTPTFRDFNTQFTYLCFTMLPYALPHLSVLYHASLCFTTPLCALQCFPMLYQTTLCFTMLPYALPDLSVLYNASLCFTRPLSYRKKTQDHTGNNDGPFSDAVKKTRKRQGHTRNNGRIFSDDEETDIPHRPAESIGLSRVSIQNTGIKASHGRAAVTRKTPQDHTGINDGPFSDDEDRTSPKQKGSGDIPKQSVKAGFPQRILSWIRALFSNTPVSDTADVTLDPYTASRNLVLSEDHKEVKLQTEHWEVDWNPQKWYSVLGTEGFTSGRHYWEVDVGKKQNWRLGVGEKSSRGTEPLNWTLGLRKGEFENDLGNRSPPSELRIVRVSLDMVGRQLSFFNAETRCEIYTVSVAKATRKLYPYFSPGGWDTDPLLIFDLNPEKLIKNNWISQSEIS